MRTRARPRATSRSSGSPRSAAPIRPASGDPAGIDAEKLAFVKELKEVRRGRIFEYAERFDGAEYFEGQRPWRVPSDIAFPCATQNELGVDDDGARVVVGNDS